VDTCSVTDGSCPFETAVLHPEYNGGRWVIVEAYGTKEEAKVGHEKWIKIMTAKTLPESLIDCCNSEVSRLEQKFGGQMKFPRQLKNN
jgi:hypothetical protein